jgi:peptidoglycan/LPS O-acetylase OafA/YrhL
MPWSWFISCDFQLYLLIPLYVIIYHKSKKAIVGLGIFLVIAGMTIVGFMAGVEGFTAGVYTLENYLMY